MGHIPNLWNMSFKNHIKTKEGKGKRMKREARWENSGRDRLSLQEIMEMYEDGYEFVVQAGHVVAVLVDF